ncbi:uncharacterized protein LOC144714422 [Wolffia australiana]
MRRRGGERLRPASGARKALSFPPLKNSLDSAKQIAKDRASITVASSSSSPSASPSRAKTSEELATAAISASSDASASTPKSEISSPSSSSSPLLPGESFPDQVEIEEQEAARTLHFPPSSSSAVPAEHADDLRNRVAAAMLKEMEANEATQGRIDLSCFLQLSIAILLILSCAASALIILVNLSYSADQHFPPPT